MWDTMYDFQRKDCTHFFIRPEIAKVVFADESIYKKRGIHIHITDDEQGLLFDIEKGKTRPFYDNQSKMITAVKEILAKQKRLKSSARQPKKAPLI